MTLSSESDDEYNAPRYVNRKVRSTVEVEVSDLVAAGFIVKDNPASSSALEDSLTIDLDHASNKLRAAKEKQDNLQNYLDIARAVKAGTIKLDHNLDDHQAVEEMINTAVSSRLKVLFAEIILVK